MEVAARDYTDKVAAILTSAGCVMVWPGRGPYSMWRSPVSGLTFNVLNAIHNKHVANATMRNAGLDYRF